MQHTPTVDEIVPNLCFTNHLLQKDPIHGVPQTVNKKPHKGAHPETFTADQSFYNYRKLPQSPQLI